jgi:hypothetical protein
VADPPRDPTPDEERRLLGEALEKVNAPAPPPPKRQRRLRKVSETVEKVWVDPRCGGSYVQWEMRPPT